MYERLSRSTARITSRLRPHHRNERGDVPGWVMITVMTIVVGTAIIGIFQPWVTSFLSETLNQIR